MQNASLKLVATASIFLKTHFLYTVLRFNLEFIEASSELNKTS